MLAESTNLSDNNSFKNKLNNLFLDNPFYIFKSFKITVCLLVNACAIEKRTTTIKFFISIIVFILYFLKDLKNAILQNTPCSVSLLRSRFSSLVIVHRLPLPFSVFLFLLVP